MESHNTTIPGKAVVWASSITLIVDGEPSSGRILGRTGVGCGLRPLGRPSVLCHYFGTTQGFILFSKNEFLKFLPLSLDVNLDDLLSNSPAPSMFPLRTATPSPAVFAAITRKGEAPSTSSCRAAWHFRALQLDLIFGK